jgi:hypothetical protein
MRKAGRQEMGLILGFLPSSSSMDWLVFERFYKRLNRFKM